MRQIDFLILFAVLVAIALFSMQNSGSVAITVLPGYVVEYPLAIELLAAAGVGAVFAWVYGVWLKMQFMMEARDKNQQLKEKEAQISKLNQLVAEMKTSLETAVNQVSTPNAAPESVTHDTSGSTPEDPKPQTQA
jgi:uncharacterized integral membrane protein